MINIFKSSFQGPFKVFEQKSESEATFRSHISKALFVENEEPKIRIGTFIEEEELFISKLKELKDSLINKNVKDILHLAEKIEELISYLETIFSQNLKEYTETELFDLFNWEILENIYSNLYIHILKIIHTYDEDLLESYKDFDVASLKIIQSRYRKLKMLKINKEDKLSEIIEEQKQFLSRCNKYVFDVGEALEKEKNHKYLKFKEVLFGKMIDIAQYEKTLLEDLIKCGFKDNDYSKIANFYLEKEDIYNLYIEHTKLNCKKPIKLGFCNDNKLNEEMYSIIITHLFNLKRSFQKFQDHAASDSITTLLYKIHTVLGKIDLLNSLENITGKILVEEFGEILYRSMFKVKLHKEPVRESVVFLFENCIVFTEETRLTPLLVCYQYFYSISTDKIRFQNPDGLHIDIYDVDDQLLRPCCVIQKDEAFHGSIEKWENLLKELILKQIKEKRDSAQIY